MFLKYNSHSVINTDNICSFFKHFVQQGKLSICFKSVTGQDLFWELSDALECDAVFESLLNVVDAKDLSNTVVFNYMQQ